MTFLVLAVKKFMGWDLPARQVQLNYSLSRVKSTPAPVLTSLYQLDKVRRNAEHDRELIRQLVLKVRQLNRCQLSIKRRLALNENLIGLFYAIAMNMLAQYRKDGGVPDSIHRQSSLDNIIEICSGLINSYKQVVHVVHSASSFRYARSLYQLDKSAFRIFDLLRLKQKVKAIRYQKLSDSAWHTANTLIHMMLQAGRADQPMVLLERKYCKGSQLKKYRMRDLYLQLQIFQRFQVLKWPVQWQTLLDHSVVQGDFKLEMKADDGKNLFRSMTLAYCYDATPCYPQRQEHKTDPALILNWEKLQHRITMDFAHILRTKILADSQTISKHLTLLSASERLALAQLQFDSFPLTTEIHTDQLLRMQDLRIFIGFHEVFQLLQHIAADGGWQGVGERMSDLLARHSSALSDDDIGTVESAWFLQYQNTQIIRLSTQETRYTKPMKIGDLIAYMLEKKDVHAPKLGVIKRLHRPQTGTIVIDIEKLSPCAEPVVLKLSDAQDASDFHADQGFPGILGVQVQHDKQNHPTSVPTVFLAHSNRQTEGCQFLIKKPSKGGVESVRGTLGTILSVSKSFSLNTIYLQNSASTSVSAANKQQIQQFAEMV